MLLVPLQIQLKSQAFVLSMVTTRRASYEQYANSRPLVLQDSSSNRQSGSNPCETLVVVLDKPDMCDMLPL